jgi:hypothetical protein
MNHLYTRKAVAFRSEIGDVRHDAPHRWPRRAIARAPFWLPTISWREGWRQRCGRISQIVYGLRPKQRVHIECQHSEPKWLDADRSAPAAAAHGLIAPSSAPPSYYATMGTVLRGSPIVICGSTSPRRYSASGFWPASYGEPEIDRTAKPPPVSEPTNAPLAVRPRSRQRARVVRADTGSDRAEKTLTADIASRPSVQDMGPAIAVP